MCEILLWVKDTATGDPATDSRQFLQGDVVTVQPDGYPWGDCELCGASTTWQNNAGQQRPMSAHPNGVHAFWRVVKLPNVSVAQAAIVLGPELPVDPLNPSPYLRLRHNFIDKAKIQSAFPAFYANFIDDLRTNPSVTVNASAGQINQVISQRPTFPWP